MLRDSSYRLPSDKIMLARDDGSWIQSDPQRLQDWVDARVDQYGPVFRRLCRFFKGWRDFAWLDCGLSSLCPVRVVDELGSASLRVRVCPNVWFSVVSVSL